MSEWLDGFSMAWGMFLAIPCPLRRWNEKAREKMLVCLPLVGLAVGGIWLGLYLLLRGRFIGFPVNPLLHITEKAMEAALLPEAACGMRLAQVLSVPEKNKERN